MNEVILPDNAPRRYLDREVLWNEVQQIEKRSDAQFAREVEVALPNEMTRDQQIECVRNFIKENFVKEGMIADWALHDKGDGNPHAHILLTLRGIDEHEQWLQKQKTVFANGRDEKGRPIYDPTKPSYDPKRKEETSSTASLNWTKTASKKSESVRARERNISGRRSQFLRTIGTITARLRSGEHLGQNTVTGILQKTSRSITEVMPGRHDLNSDEPSLLLCFCFVRIQIDVILMDERSLLCRKT